MKTLKLVSAIATLGLFTFSVQAQFIFTANNDGSLNLYQYTGSGGDVIIPSTTNGLQVTSIGDSAFSPGAFYGWPVVYPSSVTIPDSVTRIGNNAFNACYSMTKVVIGTNVTSIGGGAFWQCNSLTNVALPNCVTNIGSGAFAYCFSLTSVTIPDSVPSIGASEFVWCTSLTRVVIGTNVTSIGNNAFGQCYSLTSVTIPNSVTNIGNGAFYWCTNLIRVVIGTNVTSIGDMAFRYCYSLTAIYFWGNAPSLGSQVFFNDNNVTAYYLPGTTGWDAFSANTGVATVVWNNPPFIPNPVLSIAPMSFLSFSNLTVGGAYQMQQFAGWYWANQPVSFTATNALYTQMVAGVWDSGDFRLALNPVPSQAFATARMDSGFVVGATVTSGGSGYVTSPAVNIVGGHGTNATAVSQISGGVVTNISITSAGIGYTATPTVQIAPPPAAAIFPTVQPVMRVDSANLAPYDNYQIQFMPVITGTWMNWNGGLFTPTGVTDSQFLFITNGTGFFRLLCQP